MQPRNSRISSCPGEDPDSYQNEHGWREDLLEQPQHIPQDQCAADPSRGCGPLRTASPTFCDLARHPSSMLQPRKDRPQQREQHEQVLRHVQYARLSGHAGHIPSDHTPSTTLFSIPTTHQICTTTACNEIRSVSSLAKLNKPSRLQLLPMTSHATRRCSHISTHLSHQPTTYQNQLTSYESSEK